MFIRMKCVDRKWICLHYTIGEPGACSDIDFRNKARCSRLLTALYPIAASFLACYIEIVLLRVVNTRFWLKFIYTNSVLNSLIHDGYNIVVASCSA
jgi:hypothetical protein